ncbi:MAG TPA: MATE family efflux transporter, partial [Chitinophagales bacterium]
MFISDIYKQKIKQALTLALPIVTGQLGQVLMGFFDTVQIGGLGHEYIAASGFVNGIYWAIVLFGIGTLMSIAPLVSETFGEKNGYKSVGTFFAGLIVSLGLSIIFMAIIEVVARNLSIFGHSESDTVLGGKFLHIINYSTPFIFLFTTAKQFLDGMGKTRIGMLVTVFGLSINIFLNMGLIYGEYGFPRLEIEGSALASTIARITMTIAILLYIFQNKKVQELRTEFSAKNEQISRYIIPILAVGIPTGAQFFFEVAAFSGGQIMSGWISTEAEAAHLIAIGLA